MRVMYEQWFVQYKVDIIFAGHVHAYERSVSADSPYYNGTQCFQMTEKKKWISQQCNSKIKYVRIAGADIKYCIQHCEWTVQPYK